MSRALLIITVVVVAASVGTAQQHSSSHAKQVKESISGENTWHDLMAGIRGE